MTLNEVQLKSLNNVCDAALKNAGAAIFGDVLTVSVVCGLLKTTSTSSQTPVAESPADQAVS